MGLDNGIIVVKDNNKEERIHWRKCYDIREKIFNILHVTKCNDSGIYRISQQELKEILNYLKSVNNKKDWSKLDTIWTYDEYRSSLKFQIQELKNIIDNFLDYSEVIFYDSY